MEQESDTITVLERLMTEQELALWHAFWARADQVRAVLGEDERASIDEWVRAPITSYRRWRLARALRRLYRVFGRA